MKMSTKDKELSIYQNNPAYGLKSTLFFCLIEFVEEELIFNTQYKVGKIKDCTIKPRELNLCSSRREKTLFGGFSTRVKHGK